MSAQHLHNFSPEEWEKVEAQFSTHAGPVIDFVSENKGSLSEANDVYREAFIYYTQLLELKGLGLMEDAVQIIYSFARKLWIKKLIKRKANTDFIKHRREFFEMENAFHEIDFIKERSERTGIKLAEIGEPCRTLLLEFVGHRKPLVQVASRLGLGDEDRAKTKVQAGIKKLINSLEPKEFNFPEGSFARLMDYVLENDGSEEPGLSEEEKVGIARISRTVAMIRNYVTRKRRQQLLKDMQARITPEQSTPEYTVHHNEKRSKMKPLPVLVLASIVAACISVITAFGISRSVKPDVRKEQIAVADTAQKVEVPAPEKQEIKLLPATAFAITKTGMLITTAEATRNQKKVNLSDKINGEFTAEVLLNDTVNNIALLTCNGLQHQRLPYRFRKNGSQVGEGFYTIGYPNHSNLFYTEGNLNSEGEEGSGYAKLNSHAPGSPIFSDKGELLGMICEAENDSSDVYRLLQSEKICALIDRYAVNSKSSIDLPHRNGLFYSDRAEQVQKIEPHLFMVENSR